MIIPAWLIITGLAGFIFLIFLVTIFFVWNTLSYNIPVTILRFVGNKDRPMLIHKKAKKVKIFMNL